MLIFGDFTNMPSIDGMVDISVIEDYLRRQLGFTHEDILKYLPIVAFANGAYIYFLFTTETGDFYELISEEVHVVGIGYKHPPGLKNLKKVTIDYLLSDKFTVFPFKGPERDYDGAPLYHEDIPYYQSKQLIQASLHNIKMYAKLIDGVSKILSEV